MDAEIKGQNQIGIETKRFLTTSRGIDEPEGVRFDYAPLRNASLRLKGFPSFIKHAMHFYGHYVKLLFWADVVHWQYSSRFLPVDNRLRGLDFALLRLLKKPAIVQFHGSDFRNNLEWANVSPWWIEAFDEDFRRGLDEGSARTQIEFAEAGFVFAMSYGMLPYVWPENESRTIVLERSVDVTSLAEDARDVESGDKTVIVHSPSNSKVKGTKYVIEAIDAISKVRNVDFILLEGLSREEVISRLNEADIVIDQLLGENYGLASVEAMALGKATVANVGPALRKLFPDTLPVIDANPDTIEEVLLDLIDNPRKRVEAARKGPEYAWIVHSIETTAIEALDAYALAAKMRKRKKVTSRIEVARDSAVSLMTQTKEKLPFIGA